MSGSNYNSARPGMSTATWSMSLGILEILLDIIKGATVVLGVLAAAIADVVMGAIAVNILFGVNVSLYTNTPVGVLAAVISLGASAFQIYLFALIQKRNIGITQLLSWKRLQGEVKTIVTIAGILWALDTFMDVSPVFLLVKDSQYKIIPDLYNLMVGAVAAVVFVLCGFSELLTSNMRGILQIQSTPFSVPSFRSSRGQPSTPSRNQVPQPTRTANQSNAGGSENRGGNNSNVSRSQRGRSVSADEETVADYLRSRRA